MAHIALVLLGAGGGGGVGSQCFAAGTTGTVTAPTGATGCTVEMWGGGGGGGAAPGYGGGGAAHLKRSFSVTGGSTQIAYTVGAKGTGALAPGAGVQGGSSSILVPPSGPPDISLVAGGGGAGDSTLPGTAGTITASGGIPFAAGSAPTNGSLGTGGDAGDTAGGGGLGGTPGGTPGGGGNGEVDFGWDGGDGSVCFYWTYPTNVVLSNQSAVNFSLAGVGGSATATYRLDNAGQASRTNTSGTLVNITGQWLTSGTAADYEVYAQWSPSGGGPGGVLGGGTTGGATPDTWLSLGTTRSFTLTGVSANVERELYIQIRNATTQEIVNFCTVTVEVDSAP